jgi:hypothetical protein
LKKTVKSTNVGKNQFSLDKYRSQRKSFNWNEFNAKMKWYGLIKPRVVEKADNQIRFEECFA